MKRIVSVLMMMVMAVLASCSGEDGAQGPVGPAGTPQPVNVMLLGSDGSIVNRAVRFSSALPPGSSINYINVLDSIPPVSVLRQYHCAIVYANNTPADAAGLGDRLADYIDAGGKLVMLQGCWSNPYSVTGRITDSNYSPFTAAAGAGDATDKTIDPASLTYPLHKALVGVGIDTYVRPGNGGYSVPGVRADATILASFNGGLVAVGINAGRNIMAINDFPLTVDQQVEELSVNCALYLTGRI